MGGVVIFMVTLTIIQVRVLTIGQLMSTQRHCGKMDSTTHALQAIEFLLLTRQRYGRIMGHGLLIRVER